MSFKALMKNSSDGSSIRELEFHREPLEARGNITAENLFECL